ncbi:hypothetical protein ACHMW5_26170 [Azospirillum melinis]
MSPLFSASPTLDSSFDSGSLPVLALVLDPLLLPCLSDCSFDRES